MNFEFIEHNEQTHRAYPLDLTFPRVEYKDDECIVISGNLTISFKPSGTGFVVYEFNTGDFYHVTYSAKTNRCKKIHKLTPHNIAEINKLFESAKA